MQRSLGLLFLFAASSGLAADSDFNGRWNISVDNEARRRAWWLEVEGAGTPDLKGRFVGFPGGDMNRIQKIWIDNGELRFTFERGSTRQEYSARLAGGRLSGVMKAGTRETRWTGARAPEIKDRDDGSWREGKPVDLFNGRDLSGWHGVGGSTTGWSVADGLLKSAGSAANLESDQKFWNFKLHIEYRVGPKSNSGIGLRGRYEIQILEDHGRPPDTHSNGSLYSRIAPRVNASRPAGEWQAYDIRLVGRDLTVVLNGQEIIKGVVEGLTAMGTDPDEALPGPVSLQGDHGPVEFRKIVLTPLVK
jgi:hypothetical protein